MLRAVYKTGSTLVLEHGNDVDYIYYCETNEEIEEELKLYRRTDECCKHFRLLSKATAVFLGCYIYPYMELVEGEEIPELKSFNVCDHKKEWKELCLKHLKYMRDNDKRWYHIYATCMMFERNKPTLTKEQWKKVQKVHDEGITKELKEYCLKQLDLIQ